MKRAGLRTRLDRLERQRFRRPFPRIVMAIYGMPFESIIGYRAGKLTVLRAPDEPLDALQARAWALTASFALETLYDAVRAGQGEVAKPDDAPTAVAAPPHPFALAGIGRKATREELEQMGAIRVPPERPI